MKASTCLVALAVIVGLGAPALAQTAPEEPEPAPFGYKRDERGRLLQTHFDLRRRYYAGVHWAGTVEASDGGFQSSTAVEVGGRYEAYEEEKSRRSRFRYLEARLELQDLEIDGLLFEYARGRRSREPVLWITTFIGEPRRFDVNLDVAPGLLLGRFWLGPVGERQMVAIDVAQGHLDWEIAHGPSLEDYLALRLGGGIGVRFFTEDARAALYLYPELGVRWDWLAGSRGLTQLGFDGRVRLAHEPDSGVTWYEARAALPFERILLAISDQPVALYVQPALHVLDVPNAARVDARIDAGIRLSLFVPPREADDQCPGEMEDYDYFQDDDGCRDRDNDADGIDDVRDSCPNEPEDHDGDMDEDGCPDF